MEERAVCARAHGRWTKECVCAERTSEADEARETGEEGDGDGDGEMEMEVEMEMGGGEGDGEGNNRMVLESQMKKSRQFTREGFQKLGGGSGLLI